MIERRCVCCGSPAVNLWKSWNLFGDWVCDDCAPDDPWFDDDDDDLFGGVS